VLERLGFPAVGPHRRFVVALRVDAVGSGAWLPMSMLYFLHQTSLSLVEIGLAVTIANTVAVPPTLLLGSLVDPDPAPPGAARLATAADLDLATHWYNGFAAEVGDPVLNVERVVGDRVENGTMVLWEVDGVPVSMAGISLLLEGDGIRIGPVYTPKELRGRAYAGAATAAACRLAYKRGAREVTLFTDLANPTSNALYRRLGFRPIEDRSVIGFERGED